MLTPEQKLFLESMIDSNSLASVLEAISEICNAKEEHIRSNWQDLSLARYWQLASSRVFNCAGSSSVQTVSKGGN